MLRGFMIVTFFMFNGHVMMFQMLQPLQVTGSTHHGTSTWTDDIVPGPCVARVRLARKLSLEIRRRKQYRRAVLPLQSCSASVSARVWRAIQVAVAVAVIQLSFLPPCTGQNIGTGSASYHTCIIKQSTSGLRCCGASSLGEVPGIVGSRALSMPGTDSLTSIAEVSLGATYTCVRMTTNTVRCWGACSDGQCGNGGTVEVTTIPSTDLANLANVRRIFAGYLHVCAIVDTTPGLGGLRCWGNNGFGQLGQGTAGVNAVTPPATNAITGVSAAAVGVFSTCIVFAANGGVRCWGDNTGALMSNHFRLVDGYVAGLCFQTTTSAQTMGTIQCFQSQARI